jgi:hypothetical protein
MIFFSAQFDMQMVWVILTLIFRYVYGSASSCPSSTTEWSLYSSIAGKVIVDPTLKVACA